MPHSYGASFSGDGFFGPITAVTTMTSTPKRMARITRIKMGSVPIGGTLRFSSYYQTHARRTTIDASNQVSFVHYLTMYGSTAGETCQFTERSGPRTSIGYTYSRERAAGQVRAEQPE